MAQKWWRILLPGVHPIILMAMECVLMLWRQPFSPDSPFCFDLFLAVAFNWGLGLFFDNLPPENFPFTQNRQKSTAVTKADQHFSTSFFFLNVLFLSYFRSLMACFQAQLRVNMVAIFIPGPWRMGRRRKKRGGYGRHRPPDSVTPFRIHPSGAMSTVGATTFLPHFVVTWRASHKIYFEDSIKLSEFCGTKLFACWKKIFQKKK